MISSELDIISGSAAKWFSGTPGSTIDIYIKYNNDKMSLFGVSAGRKHVIWGGKATSAYCARMGTNLVPKKKKYVPLGPINTQKIIKKKFFLVEQ